LPKKNSNSSNKPASKKKSNSSALKIKKEIKDLKDLNNNLEDKYLRLKAEFDNFRRRKTEEFSSLLKYDGEDIIKGFLPILDDLDRLKDVGKESELTDNSNLESGLDMIFKKIDKYLESIEVKRFGKTGDKLNPELHDALMTRSEKNKEDDSILEIFEDGYSYKEKIIRHAKVVVNKA
tara:strand:- start:3078 stop:3611 length:534 start_codon:yes stop_codon:yes gene_type:complete